MHCFLHLRLLAPPRSRSAPSGKLATKASFSTRGQLPGQGPRLLRRRPSPRRPPIPQGEGPPERRPERATPRPPRAPCPDLCYPARASGRSAQQLTFQLAQVRVKETHQVPERPSRVMLFSAAPGTIRILPRKRGMRTAQYREQLRSSTLAVLPDLQPDRKLPLQPLDFRPRDRCDPDDTGPPADAPHSAANRARAAPISLSLTLSWLDCLSPSMPNSAQSGDRGAAG